MPCTVLRVDSIDDIDFGDDADANRAPMSGDHAVVFLASQRTRDDSPLQTRIWRRLCGNAARTQLPRNRSHEPPYMLRIGGCDAAIVVHPLHVGRIEGALAYHLFDKNMRHLECVWSGDARSVHMALDGDTRSRLGLDADTICARLQSSTLYCVLWMLV